MEIVLSETGVTRLHCENALVQPWVGDLQVIRRLEVATERRVFTGMVLPFVPFPGNAELQLGGRFI